MPAASEGAMHQPSMSECSMPGTDHHSLRRPNLYDAVIVHPDGARKHAHQVEQCLRRILEPNNQSGSIKIVSWKNIPSFNRAETIENVCTSTKVVVVLLTHTYSTDARYLRITKALWSHACDHEVQLLPLLYDFPVDLNAPEDIHIQQSNAIHFEPGTPHFEDDIRHRLSDSHARRARSERNRGPCVTGHESPLAPSRQPSSRTPTIEGGLISELNHSSASDSPRSLSLGFAQAFEEVIKELPNSLQLLPQVKQLFSFKDASEESNISVNRILPESVLNLGETVLAAQISKRGASVEKNFKEGACARISSETNRKPSPSATSREDLQSDCCTPASSDLSRLTTPTACTDENASQSSSARSPSLEKPSHGAEKSASTARAQNQIYWMDGLQNLTIKNLEMLQINCGSSSQLPKAPAEHSEFSKAARDGPASEREGKRVSGTASPPEDSVHAKMDDDLLTKASSMGGFHVTQLHGAAAQVPDVKGGQNTET